MLGIIGELYFHHSQQQRRRPQEWLRLKRNGKVKLEPSLWAYETMLQTGEHQLQLAPVLPLLSFYHALILQCKYRLIKSVLKRETNELLYSDRKLFLILTIFLQHQFPLSAN